MSAIPRHTAAVKQAAHRLGFSYCGIARAEALDEDARRLESWLRQGMHGSMKYMENHFDLRVDPRKLVPGAKSVITMLMNYFPPAPQSGPGPFIAKYAYGMDYHEVIRSRLREFLSILNREIGEVQGRGFVDSAPVLERSWALRSGSGWIGKNGNLISKQAGSFHFIATLIVDLELEYDDPFAKDFCGSCRRCVEACPTGAILENKVVDGSRCISYFTIELKDALIPEERKEQFRNWMFGCDICQDVCPWNRFSQPHTEPSFNALPEILHLGTKEWEEMSEEAFRTIFKGSPLKRAGYKGIRRNLAFIRQAE